MNLGLGRLTRLVADFSRESDGKLLAAYLSGSQPAFRELVDRHGPLVFGVCHRILRHRQDAEDGFQAVFLVLARRAADVWPRDAVGSWLYGVAYRVALKARTLRSRYRCREYPLEDAAQIREPSLEPDVAEAVVRAVGKLPEIYRVAVVACDLQGLSRKDAARQLNWSEGTLSSRLARARRLLANRLLKTGVAIPAAGLAMVLGTIPPVRAGLHETVMLVTSAAAGVPAPVAVLTQGVVTGMFAFKQKVVAVAAMLMTCTIGFGAYCAGAGDEPGSQPTPEKASLAVAKAPDRLNTALKQVESTSNPKPNERVITLPEGSASVLAAKLAQMMAEMQKNPVEIVDPSRLANSDMDRPQAYKLKRASAQIVATKLQTFLNARYPSQRQSRNQYRVVYDTGNNIVWVQASPTDLLDIAALITEWDTIESQAIDDVAEKTKKPVEIEVRGNQLVITSDDKEALDLLVRLVRHYSSSKPDENAFKVIRLKNISAEDAARTITEIFNGPQQNQQRQGGGVAPSVPTADRIRLVAERSSNSIVVIKSSPGDLLTIENLLGEHIEAMKNINTQDIMGPLDDKALYWYGYVSFVRGDFLKADRYFSELVEMHRESPLRPQALAYAIQAKNNVTGGAKQPMTFELRLQSIKYSDGKQAEIGFYLDKYYPEFDDRGVPRGKPAAKDLEVLIDGKKGKITDLSPGDNVIVQLSPDNKSVTKIELSLKTMKTRLDALEKEAEALRQRIQQLEKGK